MARLLRHRWFALAGALTLVFAAVSLAMPRGVLLSSISDITYAFLIFAAGIATALRAWSAQGVARRFWALMVAGYLLWSVNAVGWVYNETFLHHTIPDPWSLDVFLFLHLIPMIAAVGLRPHREQGERKFRLGTLDFMLLLVWWVFLYAFVVFPSQYVIVDVKTYDWDFSALYLVQSAVMMLVLGFVARGAGAGWKNIFLHLMLANAIYSLASQVVDLAIARGSYYSGSLYDVPLLGSVAWMAATALSARDWEQEPAPPPRIDRWGAVSVRLSMVAILSLPLLGLWTFLGDQSAPQVRTFRLATVLTAMLVLGIFVFLRQHRQDHTLIRLLDDSRRSFENEQRLQNHLVQKEKLAALGQLLAGAAREIDHPLLAIMDSSEELWSHKHLTGDQDTLLRKIVHHTQRTRDLIASLLSFAQQSSTEKNLVDLRVLLQRCLQTREMQRAGHKVRVETLLAADLPHIWGDGPQLFQAFVQIAGNGFDALHEAGGGLLRVSAETSGDEVIVEFCDNGPGIKEPHRVFDPFYTTKAVGKGTGLGLSAVYGVVQDHRGHITCQNGAEGGAVFTLRLPVARGPGENAVLAAKA